MYRITEHCPYKYRWQLVKWAVKRYPGIKVKEYSKKRLYALYYNS